MLESRTRFKFFGFILPLAIAGGLALGLMSVPAGAHHCKGNHPTEPPCNDPNPDTDEIAFLTLGGAIEVMDLVVRVSQDSPKRLQFGDNPFVTEAGDRIELHVETTDCGFDLRFNSDPDSVPTIEDLRTELSSAVIEAGFLIGRIDKKNKTAEFHIQYFVPEDSPGSKLPDGSGIRIYFREFPPRTGNFGEVTGANLGFPGTDLTIRGPIAIWWEGEHVLFGGKILVCDVIDVIDDQEVQVGQEVTVQLK